MAIHDLTAVVAPPASPFETGDKATWRQVQEKLKLKLPSDLRDFGQQYGTGVFLTNETRIEVFNPFARNYLDQVHEHACVLAGNKADVPKRFPYEVIVPQEEYPKHPALFVLGSDVDGNELCWLTKGKPDDWPVVIRSREGDFEEFAEPLTLFLAKVFIKTTRAVVWPEPIFNTTARFESRRPIPPPSELRRTIGDWYVKNGNRAEFWVYDVGGHREQLYHVKTINGGTEGPLPGIPDEYGRTPVIADVYFQGKLTHRDMLVINAHRPVFIMVAPPQWSDGKEGE